MAISFPRELYRLRNLAGNAHPSHEAQAGRPDAWPTPSICSVSRPCPPASPTTCTCSNLGCRGASRLCALPA